MQSKRDSLIEAMVNTFIGFIITCAVAPLIYWGLNIKMNITQLGLANFMFTMVSLIRNYIIRRIFNRSNIYRFSKNENSS